MAPKMEPSLQCMTGSKTSFSTIKYSDLHQPRTPGTIRSKTFEADPYANVKRATMVPCGAILCEECAQDPGEPHRYCPDHWLRPDTTPLLVAESIEIA